jgi:hypothetical protein
MTTIVTCYYKFDSKHTHIEYTTWINNFLLNVKCNIIIFTSPDLEEYFSNFGKNVHIIIKNLQDFPLYIKYKNIWDKQHEMDPIKRSIYCYVIWNSKFLMLKESIEKNPYNNDKFIWNDIGSFRCRSKVSMLANYPKYDKVSKDKLDIVLIKPFTDIKKTFFFNEVHLAGSIFGGGKNILLELCNLYYKYFDLYIDNNKFIGCDQQILATLYLKHSDKFNLIVPDSHVIDPWFFNYFYYM